MAFCDPRDHWHEPDSFLAVVNLYYRCGSDLRGVVSAKQVASIHQELAVALPGQSQNGDSFEMQVDSLKKICCMQAHVPLSLFSKYLTDAFCEVPPRDFQVAAAAVTGRLCPGPWLVVGPVIGKVTESSARILFEVDHDTNLEVVLTEEGNNHRFVMRFHLSKHRPRVVTFRDLCPDKMFSVKVKGAHCPVSSSFRTLPEGGLQAAHGAKLGVVSCNSIWTTWKLPSEGSVDLWADLAKRVGDAIQHARDDDGRIGYLLHIGDNVYNDFDWHLKKKKWEMPENDASCKWANAMRIVGTKPVSEAHPFADEVRHEFQTAYHETWGYPPTRFVMANVPNLMIFDDHEVRDDWGDHPVDKDAGSIDRFFGLLAHQLIVEYQRQLYEDLVFTIAPGHVRDESYRFMRMPTHSFHFHALGEVGFLFVDVRGCKSFHWDPERDPETPMLGHSQWVAIDRALGEDGVFARCKALIVIVPEPVAYVTGVPTYVFGHTLISDVLGMWSAAAHVKEVPKLMNNLVRWREAMSGRDVILVGGDVHEGGWSDLIVDADCHEGDMFSRRVRQITTSAVSNTMTQSHQALAVTMTRNVACGVDLYHLSGGWRFRHYDWTNWRNYALLRVGVDDGNQVAISGMLVTSNGLRHKERKERSTRDDPFTIAKEVKGVGKEAVKHVKGVFGSLTAPLFKR